MMKTSVGNISIVVTLVLLIVFASESRSSYAQQQKRSRSSKQQKDQRAKRPTFTKDQWKDVFFEDLFSEGLSGERPEAKAAAEASEESAGSTVAGNTNSWSRSISRDAIENEVKALQQKLQKLGLSVSRFNTQFRDIQQQFNLLSMMFAIVHEYDKDVRWKKYAASAQKMCAEAATKSRAPSKAAFEHAKLRKQELLELVRGGAIPITAEDANLDWSTVIDRTTIMTRLEAALSEVLKPETANAKQFKKAKDSLTQQAHLIAAMGKVVTLENMDEADEDGYVKYAEDMRSAASFLAKAIKADDFELASEAVNRIEQSCNDCHGDWR